jgi:O-antigen ligase
MSQLAILNIFMAVPGGGGFLTENRVPLFIAAFVLCIAAGLFASRLEIVKKLCIVGYIATIIFPNYDISFLVDRHFIGVPSARGLFFTAADLFLISLAIAMLLEGTGGRLKWRFPGFIPYVLYLAVAAISLVNIMEYPQADFAQPPYAYGLFELFNIFKGLLVFWIMVNLMRDPKQVQFVLTLLMGTVIIETIAVLYQQYVLHMYARSGGTLGHSNGLAMFLGLIMPTILVVMLGRRKGGPIPWLLVFVFVASIGLMTKTIARAGLVAMIVSLTLASVLLIMKERRLHAVRAIVLIITVAIGGGFIAYKYWDKISQRFGVESGEVQASNRTRSELLKIGVQVWLQSPILGNGINSFPLEITLNPRTLDGPVEEHNLYLLILCEIGVIGLVAFLAIIFRVFQHAARLIKQNVNPSLRLLAIGLLCGMVHVLLESAFEFAFRIFMISYLFWTFAAMVLGCWYMLKAQVQQIQTSRLAFARRMAATRTGAYVSAPRSFSRVR